MNLHVQIITRPGEMAKPIQIDAKITNHSHKTPRNELRNDIANKSNCEWHLVLEPWETIVSGHDAILKAIAGPPALYRIMINHGDLITKEARLWHKSLNVRWHNPVFESLQPDKDAKTLPVLVAAQSNPHTQQQLEEVRAWRSEQPLSPEPLYYESCLLLSQGKYDEFISKATTYLFNCHHMTMSVAVTRYYLAMVYCHIKKEPRQAAENLLVPLALKPLMAEFWCLLGDIHYFLSKEYHKAQAFYENAKTMGQDRKTADSWPIQLSKYGDYPNQMIDSCRSVIGNRKIIQLASKLQ